MEKWLISKKDATGQRIYTCEGSHKEGSFAIKATTTDISKAKVYKSFANARASLKKMSMSFDNISAGKWNIVRKSEIEKGIRK